MRLLLLPVVTAAAALAGCAAAPSPDGAPASDAVRTQDLVPLTTAQAARRADRIALVEARGSRVVEGSPGTPFTRTTFAVERVLKGELKRTIVVQAIGGRLGNVIVRSPVPAFTPSRRYILFLGPDGPAGPTIFPQSVLAVKRAAGIDVVAPAPDGLRLLAAGSSEPARALAAGPRLEDVLFSLERFVR